MLNETWSVDGLADLEKQLTSLGGRDGLTALRRAARAGMEPVKQQMEATAPVDNQKTKAPSSDADKFEQQARSEHMRDAIKMTSRKQFKKAGADNAVAVQVGPHRAHTQKAVAAEYGNVKQAATPFMRPALFDNRYQVLHVTKTKLAEEIKRITDKNKRG